MDRSKKGCHRVGHKNANRAREQRSLLGYFVQLHVRPPRSQEKFPFRKKLKHGRPRPHGIGAELRQAGHNTGRRFRSLLV